MTSFDKVRRCAFHADLIERTVRDLNGGELPEVSLFNLETSFDDDSVFRHLDYVALSSGEKQLLALHLDELATGIRWVATVVPLKDVGQFELAQVLLEPEGAGGAADGVGNELMVHLAFGGNTTMELEKVLCDDPECDFDHGYSGFIKRDGLAMRFEENPADLTASSIDDAMIFVRRVTAAIAG